MEMMGIGILFGQKQSATQGMGRAQFGKQGIARKEGHEQAKDVAASYVGSLSQPISYLYPPMEEGRDVNVIHKVL